MFPNESINKWPSICCYERREEEGKVLPEDEVVQQTATGITQSKKFAFWENRFLADSPYYDAFVEKEIRSAELLFDTLQEIGTGVATFAKTTETQLKSLNSLSVLCQKFSTSALKNKDHRMRDLELDTNMLNAFGETLAQISAAQKNLFEIIGTSLGYQFMELSVKQRGVIDKLKKLKKTSDAQTKRSEQEMCNYLNGKNAAGNSNDCVVPPPPSKEIILFLPNSKRMSSIGAIPNPTEGRPSLGPSKSCKLFRSSRHLPHELHWTQRIQTEETKAVLKRYQLVNVIVDAKYERRLAINQSIDEIIEAAQKCFQRCSQKVGKMRCCLDKDQKECVDFQENKKPLWKEREKALIQTLTTIKRAREISLPNGNDGEKLAKFECDAHLLDIPYQLAIDFNFYRPSPRNDLMEGWLYQKCTSMLSLQTSWTRRWFILKSDGLYYLEASAEFGKFRQSNGNTSSNSFQVKLFDFALCTVREVPNKSSARFCFELVNSSNKTIFLQARGPEELQSWLDRIRSALGSQLAKANYEMGNDTPSIRRICFETYLPSVCRQSCQVWDRENGGRVSGVTASAASSATTEAKSEECIEMPIIMQVLKANPRCADCGMDSPEWASLNLGILVCLECSGVHRSLGCHISKIRSLTLDTLSDEEASLLLSLGNKRVNEIWEKGMTHEAKILNEAACLQSHGAREDWIKRKYVKKEFIGRCSHMDAESEEALSQQLQAASKRGDVVGIASAIAHGSNLDWKTVDENSAICTALGICVMRAHDGEKGAVECAELLLQNGAKLGGNLAI